MLGARLFRQYIRPSRQRGRPYRHLIRCMDHLGPWELRQPGNKSLHWPPSCTGSGGRQWELLPHPDRSRTAHHGFQVQVPSELRRCHALGGDVLGEQSDQWRQLCAEHQADVNWLFLPWFDDVKHCYIKHDQHNTVYLSHSVCNNQLRVPNLWLHNINPDQPGFYVNMDFQYHP